MLYGKLLLLNKIKGPLMLAASDASVGFKTGIIIWKFFIKYVCTCFAWGFPGGACGKELSCQCRRHK